MGELPPCPYLEELKRQDESARGVVASATTSEEKSAQPMSQNVARAENVQNEPISPAPRAACDQASQEIVIMEPVKLARTSSHTSRDDAQEGPISPGA